MKIITVTFTTTPGNRDAVIKLCRSMIAPSRAEAGCISYKFYQNVADENEFFFYEEWKDQNAIDAHNNSAHYRDFSPKFASLITGNAGVVVRSVQ